MAADPSSCCIPSVRRLHAIAEAREVDRLRPRATAGPASSLIRLDGGRFLMGSESVGSFPADGEGPVREVSLSPFYLAPTAVTNKQFASFVRSSGFKTDAERLGWSFVFQNFVAARNCAQPVATTPWWRRVYNACWHAPEGLGSSIRERLDHPVVHVSWNDAQAYCEWAGYRLPTEAEWEYAARGGLEQKTFPWGDEFSPGGIHQCNTWQGTFPTVDLAEDGFAGTAPANAFRPNGFGMFNMVGNVWEWCWDKFDRTWHVTAPRYDPAGPVAGYSRVMKGGSYLCHESYCFRYRNSARTGNTPDSSTGNLGFRVALDT